jgi:4'-phosphopantetheinyl transferase
VSVLPSPGRPQWPAPEAVDVWVVPLDDPDKRRRRELANLALRELLGGYLQREPETLELSRLPSGKPVLPGAALEFNLSHSGALAVIAVSATAAVGIDIQGPHRTLAKSWFGPRVCTARELAALGPGAPDPDQLLRLWVRKEAVIKARGEGSYVAAGEIDVLDDRLPDGLICVDLELPEHPAYRAAIATRWAPGFSVVTRERV